MRGKNPGPGKMGVTKKWGVFSPGPEIIGISSSAGEKLPPPGEKRKKPRGGYTHPWGGTQDDDVANHKEG